MFISSLNGKVSFPLLGAYCASKFALEAAADALRIELKPWGIPVVLVEPAQTDTDMWRTADAVVAGDGSGADTRTPRPVRQAHRRDEEVHPGFPADGGPPEKVSAVVEEALTARRPRARYVVGIGPKVQLALISNLPTRARDRVLRMVSGQP